MSYREGVDLTPGGFPYRQAPHQYCGSNADRQSVGDPGHCEDCCSVGHIVAHPELGCADVGCYADHEVTLTSDGVPDQGPVDDRVDMGQVLPGAMLRELAGGFSAVLELAQARGCDVDRQSQWAAAWVAPLLAVHRVEYADVQHAAMVADLRLQLEQAGATLAQVLATSAQVRECLSWLDGVANARAAAARRLRSELWSALANAERFRGLREQSCPRGLHDGWFVASEHQYACPWCQILELRGDVSPTDDPHRVDLADELPPGADGDAPANVLSDLLLLVGVTATEDQINGWSLDERRDAEEWAIAAHLSASDNPVEVPVRPAFLAGGAS